MALAQAALKSLAAELGQKVAGKAMAVSGLAEVSSLAAMGLILATVAVITKAWTVASHLEAIGIVAAATWAVVEVESFSLAADLGQKVAGKAVAASGFAEVSSVVAMGSFAATSVTSLA